MTTQEIEFCKYFEKVMLPNKRRITIDMVREGERIMNMKNVIGNCNSCLHGAAVDLSNLYNRMKPAWDEFQKRLKELELTQNVAKLEEKVQPLPCRPMPTSFDIELKAPEGTLTPPMEPEVKVVPRTNLKNIKQNEKHKSKL